MINGVEGIVRMKKDKDTHYEKYVKFFCKAQGVDALPDLKVRRMRRKETVPRQPYNLEEAEFRRESIKYLRRKGCKVKRIENSIVGKLGDSIPDLQVFCLRTRWGGVVELKSSTGKLSQGQKEYQEWCLICNIKYLIARTLSDYDEIFKNEKGA